ncbi:hypothetical protein A2U01_0063844, partial [Trifolium medium]|nr:hypothetical protein [Trifolium medium]
MVSKLRGSTDNK